MLADRRRSFHSHGQRLGRFEQLESRHLLAVLPVLAADVDPAPVGSDPRNFFVHEGSLYFSALAADLRGHELWRFDGERAAQVSDINPTGRTADPKEFASYRGQLFFQADGSDDSPELWSSNGADVSLVADIMPGDDEEGSYPENLTVFGDNLYFTGRSPNPGSGLLRYDGEDVSIIPLADDGQSSFTHAIDVAIFQDTLYFLSREVEQYSLYRLDGEAAKLAATVQIGVPQQYWPVSGLTAVGDQLLLVINDEQSGSEIWAFDGESLTQVADIRPGSEGSGPSELFEFQGRLYFAADDGVHGRELWQFDGQSAQQVADLNSGGDANPRDLAAYRDTLYFSADDGTTGRELWRYDGTTAVRITDLNTSGDSIYDGFAVFNDELYFAATDVPRPFDGEPGAEVWKYDGETVQLAIDVRPGSRSSYPQHPIEFQGSLYFGAYEGATGLELWAYDGQSAAIVSDAAPGHDFSNPYGLVTYKNELYFKTSKIYDPSPIWRFDGQSSRPLTDAAGNVLLIYSGADIVEFDDSLYFAANNAGNSGDVPTGLWRWDGENLTTVNLPSRLRGHVYTMAAFGGSLFLNRYSGGVWRYDGEQFTDLTDFFPSEAQFDEARYIDGLLYFNGRDSDHGTEFWVSDFTAAGTRRITDLAVGGHSSNPRGFMAFDGDVIFAARRTWTADGGNGGTFLWRFDGENVTQIEIPTATVSGNEGEMFLFDDAIYFAASDPLHGQELWRYDGQTAKIVADIAAGPLDSYPNSFVVYNGELHFSAFDLAHGNELRRLATVPDGDLDGDGHVGLLDLARLRRNFGRAFDALYADGDLNGDGKVNRSDIVAIARQFGQSLTPSAAASALLLPARASNTTVPTILDVRPEVSRESSNNASRFTGIIRNLPTPRRRGAAQVESRYQLLPTETVAFKPTTSLRASRHFAKAGRLASNVIRAIDTVWQKPLV